MKSYCWSEILTKYTRRQRPQPWIPVVLRYSTKLVLVLYCLRQRTDEDFTATNLQRKQELSKSELVNQYHTFVFTEGH
jgi:hypothetical protein